MLQNAPSVGGKSQGEGSVLGGLGRMIDGTKHVPVPECSENKLAIMGTVLWSSPSVVEHKRVITIEGTAGGG